MTQTAPATEQTAKRLQSEVAVDVGFRLLWLIFWAIACYMFAVLIAQLVLPTHDRKSISRQLKEDPYTVWTTNTDINSLLGEYSVYAYFKDGSEMAGYQNSIWHDTVGTILAKSYKPRRYFVSPDGPGCEVLYLRPNIFSSFTKHCVHMEHGIPPDIQEILDDGRKKLVDERQRAQRYADSLSLKK